jgi:hypothetical protein
MRHTAPWGTRYPLWLRRRHLKTTLFAPCGARKAQTQSTFPICLSHLPKPLRLRRDTLPLLDTLKCHHKHLLVGCFLPMVPHRLFKPTVPSKQRKCSQRLSEVAHPLHRSRVQPSDSRRRLRFSLQQKGRDLMLHCLLPRFRHLHGMATRWGPLAYPPNGASSLCPYAPAFAWRVGNRA